MPPSGLTAAQWATYARAYRARNRERVRKYQRDYMRRKRKEHGSAYGQVKSLEQKAARAYSQRPTLLDRIMSKVRKTDACWLWTGFIRPDGYVTVSLQGKHFLAHRILYELVVGPIPQGLTLDHLCRNRSCLNP